MSSNFTDISNAPSHTKHERGEAFEKSNPHRTSLYNYVFASVIYNGMYHIKTQFAPIYLARRTHPLVRRFIFVFPIKSRRCRHIYMECYGKPQFTQPSALRFFAHAVSQSHCVTLNNLAKTCCSLRHIYDAVSLVVHCSRTVIRASIATPRFTSACSYRLYQRKSTLIF